MAPTRWLLLLITLMLVVGGCLFYQRHHQRNQQLQAGQDITRELGVLADRLAASDQNSPLQETHTLREPQAIAEQVRASQQQAEQLLAELQAIRSRHAQAADTLPYVALEMAIQFEQWRAQQWALVSASVEASARLTAVSWSDALDLPRYQAAMADFEILEGFQPQYLQLLQRRKADALFYVEQRRLPSSIVADLTQDIEREFALNPAQWAAHTNSLEQFRCFKNRLQHIRSYRRYYFIDNKGVVDTRNREAALAFQALCPGADH